MNSVNPLARQFTAQLIARFAAHSRPSLFSPLPTTLLLAVFTVAAHAGGEHADPSAAPASAPASAPVSAPVSAPISASAGGVPQRLPDGGVFLPKPVQRQLGVVTLKTRAAALPRTRTLSGRVTMDPNAGGKVQALVAGRIAPGPHGLPSVGQRVARGAVLAWVIPAMGAAERSNQAAQLAELRAARALAEKRLARLETLSDMVSKKDIEAAASDVDSLGQRIAAVDAGLNRRDALISPVSGVIASAGVVAGQVVDARELVFEVVDPDRFQVEALAYDFAIVDDIASASLAQGERRIPLSFVGAARSLREQALPLVFRAGEEEKNGKSGKTREKSAENGLTALLLGQPVQVFVQGRATIEGMRVPTAALVKNPANQSIVWVKTAPERFEPRLVTVEALDGATVAVTSGLVGGDRVVIRAANLINQVRG